MKQLILALALSAGLVAVAGGSAAAAAAAPASTPSWGVVDMDRVSGEYKGMQVLNQQFQEFQKQQEGQVQRHQKNRLLFDDEQREYLDLCAPTAAPTAERDKRLADLEKLSDERSRRLLDLGQKKDRTPDEEQEYQKLDRVYKQRTDEGNALQGDAQKAVLAKYEEFSRIITDSVNTAVKAVAQEKKLPIVVRKEIVLYGGLDISEEVIAKLNAAPLPAIAMQSGPVPKLVETSGPPERPAGKPK
jgi:Skp family chaperone for outer membrane proteins